MMQNEDANNVVPLSSPEHGGNGGSGFGERLARIEAKMDDMATSKDISDIKTFIAEKESSMLRWLMGLVVVATVSLSVALIRTFIS